MRDLPRSKKKRIVKKWFKKTGNLKILPFMKKGCIEIDEKTMWFYEIPNW